MLSNHKTALFISILTLISVFSYGQRSLGLTVISAYGHEASSATFEVIHTMGELMTETFTGTSGNKVLTQGFHQGDGINVEVQKSGNSYDFVYPNPTRDFIYLRSNDNDNPVLMVELFDITGKMVMNDRLDSRAENKLNISSFKNGIYLLRVSNVKGKVLSTHKIEKIN